MKKKVKFKNFNVAHSWYNSVYKDYKDSGVLTDTQVNIGFRVATLQAIADDYFEIEIDDIDRGVGINGFKFKDPDLYLFYPYEIENMLVDVKEEDPEFDEEMLALVEKYGYSYDVETQKVIK